MKKCIRCEKQIQWYQHKYKINIKTYFIYPLCANCEYDLFIIKKKIIEKEKNLEEIKTKAFIQQIEEIKK